MAQGKKSSFAFLLSMLALAGLMYFSFQDRHHYQSDTHAQYEFSLNLELQWLAEANQVNFEAVQDTFQHYTRLLGAYSGAQSSDFKLDHCCPSAQLGPDESAAYKFKLSMKFASADASQRILQAMVDQGYLQPQPTNYRLGFAQGLTALELPVPHSDGAVLRIPISAFRMSLETHLVGWNHGAPQA